MHNIFSTHSKRNYCFIWGICPRGRIREFLQSIVYYSLIADELFGSYVNKELLLLSLRFLQNIGKNVIVQESLLDSVQHLTFRQQKKILQSVYQICQTSIKLRFETVVNNPMSASSRSSDNKGTQSHIKNLQPKAAYTLCQNHILNQAIANVCKNSPIQRFMTSLTVARNFLDTSSRRQQYFEHFINLFKKYLFFSESNHSRQKNTKLMTQSTSCAGQFISL